MKKLLTLFVLLGITTNAFAKELQLDVVKIYPGHYKPGADITTYHRGGGCTFKALKNVETGNTSSFFSCHDDHVINHVLFRMSAEQLEQFKEAIELTLETMESL